MQAAKPLSAHSRRGISVQDSFHHLRFEQSYLERQSGVPSIVQLGTVSSDNRPSAADATLNFYVKVHALADRYTHSVICLLYRWSAASTCGAFDTVLGSDYRCMASVFFSDAVSPNS